MTSSFVDGGIHYSALHPLHDPQQALWPGEIQRMPAWSYSGGAGRYNVPRPAALGRTVCRSAGTCGSGICVTVQVRGILLSEYAHPRPVTSHHDVSPRPAATRTSTSTAQSCNEAAAQ
ncbi:uncharacterized protein TRIVIDRAFT_207465 [Trichoderma virens Gv29-8]|uniref:Uncharacterized protein n=1 Tax=Hypocrea virens (strain Gv29-8 / FGSC 10586) TaxID=413071 RepID=G9NDI1_HYPVG|nr:uncharacterized protein TRIVIDRAFT_207465 [Trichoderma virens Gv29-8]EHK15748.1 hypothetical protein TRIVIDRAFT_207465 [Trichoderma virens Gv29-8]